MKRILLFGGTGQIGRELARLLPALGKVHTPGRAEADFRDPDALYAYVCRTRPDILVNAAAYTDVDAAEQEREKAFRINAAAPESLAKAAEKCGALLVHYSTDYVFDGRASRPYRETDRVHPLNVYGHSKRAGEEAVLSTGARALVLRPCWMYGLQGHNILLTLRRLAAEGKPLRVVHDQIGTPTWSRCVAEGTVAALRHARRRTFAEWGLFHMTCAGAASWYEFARALLRDAVPVQAIRTAERPRPATRPAYSVLDNSRLTRVFGIRLPDWDQALQTCLNEEPHS